MKVEPKSEPKSEVKPAVQTHAAGQTHVDTIMPDAAAANLAAALRHPAWYLKGIKAVRRSDLGPGDEILQIGFGATGQPMIVMVQHFGRIPG